MTEQENMIEALLSHLKSLEAKDDRLTDKLIDIAQKHGEVGQQLKQFADVIEDKFAKIKWWKDPNNYWKMLVLFCLVLIIIMGGQLKIGEYEFSLREGLVKNAEIMKEDPKLEPAVSSEIKK